ncbi:MULTISPECIES: acyl carrier protein [Arenibacter]|uniref:acyl carrier protein n=1 Tax=Arenibacter TaxID=178469 RepID=UPI000A3BED87|nr:MULTISPECIES: acyl carrier protein [Arenibacter]
MNEILITYICEDLLNNELESGLSPQDDLLGSGILDSLGMMKLILFIEQKYNITVPPQDMIIENFMTVSHITNYLTNKEQS